MKAFFTLEAFFDFKAFAKSLDEYTSTTSRKYLNPLYENIEAERKDFYVGTYFMSVYSVIIKNVRLDKLPQY